MNDENHNFTIEYTLIIDKCPCGSGKKPEKCCGPVKPRIYTADLDARNFYESDSIGIGFDHTLVRYKDGKQLPIIGEAKFKLSHNRDGKTPKVIVKGIADKNYTMRPDSILVGYDHVFVIDTNTKKVGEDIISLSGVWFVIVGPESIKIIPITVYEFWNAQINPELLGWYALITGILNNAEVSKAKIGILVDSNLDLIEKLNSGKMPLFEEFYVPKNITLSYASSDKGGTIVNKIMKQADRLASLKFETLQEDLHKESLHETPYPCEYFRQWLP